MGLLPPTRPILAFNQFGLVPLVRKKGLDWVRLTSKRVKIWVHQKLELIPIMIWVLRAKIGVLCKVHVLYEGHKNWNLQPSMWNLLQNVKWTVKILKILCPVRKHELYPLGQEGGSNLVWVSGIIGPNYLKLYNHNWFYQWVCVTLKMMLTVGGQAATRIGCLIWNASCNKECEDIVNNFCVIKNKLTFRVLLETL